MISKTLQLILALLTVGVVAWFVTVEVRYQQARVTLNSLEEKYGPSEVVAPEKYLVKCVEHESHRDFVWRIHTPLTTSPTVCSFGSRDLREWQLVRHRPSEKLLGHESFDDLYRCQFLFNKNSVTAHVTIDNSTYEEFFRFDDELMTPFLKQHFDELEFQVMGDLEFVTALAEAPIDLLTIGIPDELQQKLAGGEFSSLLQEFENEDLFRLQIGTRKQFVQARKQWNAIQKSAGETKLDESPHSREQP